jgi:hypothetical protein
MSELVHQLRLELHLKDADNKFLQTELEKSNELVSAKDSMLSMLTEGLKEVSSSLFPPLPPPPSLLSSLLPPSGRGQPSHPLGSQRGAQWRARRGAQSLRRGRE